MEFLFLLDDTTIKELTEMRFMIEPTMAAMRANCCFTTTNGEDPASLATVSVLALPSRVAVEKLDRLIQE